MRLRAPGLRLSQLRLMSTKKKTRPAATALPLRGADSNKRPKINTSETCYVCVHTCVRNHIYAGWRLGGGVGSIMYNIVWFYSGGGLEGGSSSSAPGSITGDGVHVPHSRQPQSLNVHDNLYITSLLDAFLTLGMVRKRTQVVSIHEKKIGGGARKVKRSLDSAVSSSLALISREYA